MTLKLTGTATMLLIFLQSLALTVEGGTLPYLLGNERLLPLTQESNEENIVENDRLNPKFFQNMVNTNHELTAVESNQRTSEFQFDDPQSSQLNDVLLAEDDSEQFLSLPELKRLLETQETFVLLPQNPKEDVVLVVVPDVKSSVKPYHHRQRRFISAKKLRVIAVPLSVFNFLGFLPVRVPGLPYHDDLPPPDYTYYNTKHELSYPERMKYF